MADKNITLSIEELNRIIQEKIGARSEVKVSDIISEIQSAAEGSETSKMETEKKSDSGKNSDFTPAVNFDVDEGVKNTDVSVDTVELVKAPEGGSDFVVFESATVTSGGGAEVIAEVEETPEGGDNPMSDAVKVPGGDSTDETPSREVEVATDDLAEDSVMKATTEQAGGDSSKVDTSAVGEDAEEDQEGLLNVTTLDVPGSVGKIKMEEDENQSKSASNKSARKKRKAPATSSVRKQSLRSAKKTKADREMEKNSAEAEVIEIIEEHEDKHRVLVEDHQIVKDFFESYNMVDVYDMISFQGWQHLFNEDVVVNLEDVYEFYKNVKKEEKGDFMYLHFEFKGQWFTVNSGQIATMFGLEHTGFDTFTKGAWPKSVDGKRREQMQRKVCNYSNSTKTTLSTTLMEPEMKVLHKLLVTNFMPRNSKPSLAQIQDILVLYHIAQKEKVNLPKLMIHQMEYVSKLKDVGYARFVKRILEVQLVYAPQNEVSVTKPLDDVVLKKLSMEFKNGNWVRKPKAEVVEEEDSEVPEQKEEKTLLEQLSSEVAANRKEIAGMRKEFKKLNDSMWILEDDVKEIKEEIKDIKEMIQQVWAHIKKSSSGKGSSAGKGSRT